MLTNGFGLSWTVKATGDLVSLRRFHKYNDESSSCRESGTAQAKSVLSIRG
jgi:hypothetical protein